MPDEKRAVHLGVDWGNGKSFTGLTLVADGKIIGTVTSISPPKIDYGPDVVAKEIPHTEYVISNAKPVEFPITEMWVNWPFMAELKRREIDEFLAGREPNELSAEEVVQLLTLVTIYEDLKKRPDEFEGDEEPA